MKQYLIYFIFIFPFEAIAQEKPKHNAEAGILIGANLGQFYRLNTDRFRLPANNVRWNYQIGLSNDAINGKYYKLRWELAFTRKGAFENFDNGISTKIAAKSDLSYVQANLLPIVITPFHYQSLSPVLGIGGYANYLVGGKIKTSVNGSDYALDRVGFDNMNKIDYGALIILGFYYKKVTLEYRHEIGLPKLVDQTKALSSIKNKTSSIVLIIR